MAESPGSAAADKSDDQQAVGGSAARVGPIATGANAAPTAFVWLVISTNGRVMSVLDNEAAAKHVAGDHWIVECWAVRHLDVARPA